MGAFAAGVGDEELDAPRVGYKGYPKGAFGPGAAGPFLWGWGWPFAYAAAVAGGGLVLPFWAFLEILRSGQEGVRAGGLLFFLALISLAGTAGAVGGVALVHLTVAAVRYGSRLLSEWQAARTRK